VSAVTNHFVNESLTMTPADRDVRESGIFRVRPSSVASVPAPADSATTLAGESKEALLQADAELVDRMLFNEPRAWREFQARYDRLIHRCIMKVTRRFASVVSMDDVREICSTLYVSLLANDKHKLRTFDPARGNRLSSWVGLLAINSAYDHLRSLRREPNKASLSEAFELACELPDPFDCAVERERAEMATEMLDGFSDKDRTFAALYFGEELDPVEIAERMNISVKTVYSKKHKIQSRLGSHLTKNAA
jgi:RNA polymerase sigma-70 factor (ECF subfamily)